MHENAVKLWGLLREAESYLESGDAVQASEKLYKIVEGSVKILSQRRKDDEGIRHILEEVERRADGRWGC
ncbi:PaREP1 family protein [Vulcanisaeta thermophila]|uniref:PaREP1 family protein n=1 Tax=Vulcanisaeta thermophila TaxID=867917 RepID=UPI00117EBDBA|nr:PaREP1 family protein [Vulcanisaeta thermophila]